MAISPQVLKLISMLVPQEGTSSLTRRALARGLTRDEPVPIAYLVELIAKRSPPAIARDRNFKESLSKGIKFEVGAPQKGGKAYRGYGFGPKMSAEELKALPPEERRKLMDRFRNAPEYEYRGSAREYEKLLELRKALMEILG